MPYAADLSPAGAIVSRRFFTEQEDGRNIAMWQERLSKYLDAKAKHDQAKHIMRRAERLAWKHLAKRVGDDRAYQIAGVALADERSVRAYREMRLAFDELKAALEGRTLLDRLAAGGAVLCADLPRAANDR